MLNRHAASKINIRNAIKTQGQRWMLIRKCNRKNHHRLIATNGFCKIPRMHLSSLWKSSSQSGEASNRGKNETLYQLIAYWRPLSQPPPHNLLSGPFHKPYALNSPVTWQHWWHFRSKTRTVYTCSLQHDSTTLKAQLRHVNKNGLKPSIIASFAIWLLKIYPFQTLWQLRIKIKKKCMQYI